MQTAMIMKNVLTDNANLVAQMMIIAKRVSSALMALVFNLVNQAKIAQRVTIAILIIKSVMRNVTVILIALEDTHVSMENVCCVVVCPNIAIQISIVTGNSLQHVFLILALKASVKAYTLQRRPTSRSRLATAIGISNENQEWPLDFKNLHQVFRKHIKPKKQRQKALCKR